MVSLWNTGYIPHSAGFPFALVPGQMCAPVLRRCRKTAHTAGRAATATVKRARSVPCTAYNPSAGTDGTSLDCLRHSCPALSAEFVSVGKISTCNSTPALEKGIIYRNNFEGNDADVYSLRLSRTPAWHYSTTRLGYHSPQTFHATCASSLFCTCCTGSLLMNPFSLLVRPRHSITSP